MTTRMETQNTDSLVTKIPLNVKSVRRNAEKTVSRETAPLSILAKQGARHLIKKKEETPTKQRKRPAKIEKTRRPRKKRKKTLLLPNEDILFGEESHNLRMESRGVSRSSLVRICQRAGVLRSEKRVFDYLRVILEDIVDLTSHHALVHTKSMLDPENKKKDTGRKIVSHSDVKNALNITGLKVYG